jgi:Fur family ferric uptake transcriptional regulator
MSDPKFFSPAFPMGWEMLQGLEKPPRAAHKDASEAFYWRIPEASIPLAKPSMAMMKSDSPETPAASRIEAMCVEQGLKMTGQRRLIARILSEAEDHPDVEELHRRALERDKRVSIATVYRTVRLLEERGILERRDFGGGRARYDLADRGHHHHLIDVESGHVIEFADEVHEALAQAIARRLGYDLVGHKLELFGKRRVTHDTPPQRNGRKS